MEKEIVLLHGYSSRESRKVLEDCRPVLSAPERVIFYPLLPGAGEVKVRELFRRAEEGAPLPSPEDFDEATAERERALFRETKRRIGLLRCSKETALILMRGFKKLPYPREDFIFALVTETAMEWNLSYYFSHLNQEHEFMKENDPAKDKDMRAF